MLCLSVTLQHAAYTPEGQYLCHMTLQEHSGVWMRRAVLRSLVIRQGKDAALVDALLKAVADTVTGDFAVFRCS